MTAAPTTAPVPTPKRDSCEFCEKRGLPLLLVRTAVAPAGAGAPLAGDLEVPLASGAAHYTTRLLRQGYVFVYDEARNSWQIYAVNPQGYMFKVPSKPGKYPVPGEFNCSTEGHRQIASCITIPDPKNATRIWIGFSEAMWTQAVMNKHAKEDYRNLHMVELNVKNLLAGQDGPFSRPIAQVSAVVAEYALDNKVAKSVFDHSPFPPDGRFGTAERLKQECEKMFPGKGRIVTLSDPTAIVQELAVKMSMNAQTFVNHPSRKRQVIADQMIDSLEKGVRIRSKKMQELAAEELIDENNREYPQDRFKPRTLELNEQMRHQSEEVLLKAADEDWVRYSRKFNGIERKKWKDKYLAELGDFDLKFIAPLARNHVSWMQSKALLNYFRCNFDDKDAGSGVAYTEVFVNCTMATQDKAACSRLYDDWLTGSPGEKHNLLMRAMTLNQEKVAAAVHAVHVGSSDWRQIAWDSILGIQKEAIGKLSADAGNVSAKLLVNVMGSLVKIISKVLEQVDKRTGMPIAGVKKIIGEKRVTNCILATLGLIANKPIHLTKMAGTHADFRDHLIKLLLDASGDTVNHEEMKKAVGKAMHVKGIRGVTKPGAVLADWAAMPDKTIIPAPATLTTPEERANFLAAQLNSTQEIAELDSRNWKAHMHTNLKFGVVAAILQLACLTKVLGDQEKTLSNESTEATGRMFTSLLAFATTTVDIVGNFMKGRQAFTSGVLISSITHESMLLKISRFGGLVTGVAMALWDIYHMTQEIKQKGDGVVILAYGASALVGGALSAILCFGMGLALAIPIIGVLIFLLIGIGLWLETIKDNPVQDWLERCPWGNLEAERYRDLATEQAELVKALK